jgi:hypothetical protein
MWDKRVRADPSTGRPVSVVETAVGLGQRLWGMTRLPGPGPAPVTKAKALTAPEEEAGRAERSGAAIAAGFSLRWLAGVLVCTALGLVCVGVGDAASRAGRNYSSALAFFWLGLVLIFLPVAVRVLMRDVAVRERLSLIVVLGAALYGVKIAGSPHAFTFVDEYIHLRNTQDILRTGHLFRVNPLLHAAAYYPGLAAATAGLVSLTGLSTFVAGLLMVGAARILISTCFFLVAARVTRSSRAAAGASLVYAANPMFLFWSSSFSYEDLALPLAAFAIWWLGRTRQEAGRLVPIVTVSAIAAVVVIHHVSAFALTGLLAAWWLAERLTRRPAAEEERSPAGRRVLWAAAARPPGRGHSVGLMALVAGAGAVAWLQFVARPAESYLLNANIIPPLQQLGSVLVGHTPVRHPYTGGGATPPVWYVLAGLAAIALLLLGLPLALRRDWRAGFLPRRTEDGRRKRGHVPMIVATAVAVIFPLTLLPRLTSTGGPISARSSEYVFTGLACVLGLLAVDSTRLRHDEQKPRVGQRVHAGGRRTLALAVVVTAIFLGEVTIGTPYGQLLPESSHPHGYPSMIQPDVIRAAGWTRKHLGMNQRFGANAIDSLALATYGEQDPVSGADVWPVFFAKTMNGTVVQTIQALRIRYVFVDWRMTRSRPLISGNSYFDSYEPHTGIYSGPFPAVALRKFASTVCARLVYHSGPIQIFDVSRIQNGSCMPAIAAVLRDRDTPPHKGANHDTSIEQNKPAGRDKSAAHGLTSVSKVGASP